MASGLEGFGTIYFDWGSITRDKEDALTIQANENLEDEERGLIINLSTSSGLYTEQIIVQQNPGDKYEIKSITYSLEEGDGEFWMDSRPMALPSETIRTIPPLLPYFLMTMHLKNISSTAPTILPSNY